MKMKRIVALLMATTMVLGLVACGNSSTGKNGGNDSSKSNYDWTAGADASGGDVTLRVATWKLGNKPYYEEMVKRFEEKYDWINVEMEFTGESSVYYSNLQADLGSGTAPDVFDSHPNSNYLAYVEGGVIAPQTDFDYMKNYSDDAKLVTVIDGENYGYMSTYNYFGFLYNKEIFQKEGVAVPTTPDELVAAVNKFKDAGYGGIIYPGKSNNYAITEACVLIALGTDGYGKLMSGIDDGSITDVSKVEGMPEALKTAQYYIENDAFYTAWEGITSEGGMSLYAQEKSPIIFFGSYVFGEKETYFPDIDTGFFPIPTYANTGLTYTQGGTTSCINAAGKNLGAAKLWVEFIATAEIAGYYCTNAKELSTIKGVEPTFDGAAELIGACTGYSARALKAHENDEYWKSGYESIMTGILEGEDWEALVKKFTNKLDEYDLKNK